MDHLTADEIRTKLQLQGHPTCGYYNETFRSTVTTPTDRLHDNDGIRSMATVIYFLLTPGSSSGKLCKNMSEIVHVWCGGGATVHTFILPDGTLTEHVLGPRIDLGESPQVLCPGRAWKTSRCV